MVPPALQIAENVGPAGMNISGTSHRGFDNVVWGRYNNEMEASMYAIIKMGGRQYTVSPGQSIEVESLAADVGETLEIDQVLLVGDDGQILVGKPTVLGAVVRATVVDHVRGRRRTTFKFRGGNRYHVKRGHRQGYTRLVVEDIVRGGARKKKRAAPRKAKKTPKPARAKKAAASPDISIEALDLPTRVLGSLKEAGLQTVGDLLERDEEELLSIKGFGAKSLEQVRAALKDKGFAK